MTPRLHVKGAGPLEVVAPVEYNSPYNNSTYNNNNTTNNSNYSSGAHQYSFSSQDRKPQTRRQSQSQQSSLARAAMINQRRASLENAADVPRSIPTPPEQAIAVDSDPPIATFDNDTLALLPSRNGASASPPTPTSLNGDNAGASYRSTPSQKGLAPPALNTLPYVSLGPAAHPPTHPSSLASALRVLNDGHTGGAFRDFPTPSSNDSPYTKSISSTAPGSPRIPPVRQNSGSQTPRVRPHATTLSIPGMTRSLISPDGKIADRDVAAKLVIVMVGLPARGKSYITKKLRRYLSWQQHNTRIFNVGNRRRVAVTSPTRHRKENSMDMPPPSATILVNGSQIPDSPMQKKATPSEQDDSESQPIDQSAKFFDPKNEQASKLREEIAIDTLNELLDYLLTGGGSVGILDATNSTIHRRQSLFDHIKAREPKLGILFIESVCKNPTLLEANMRLKLSGPDYKDKDPVKSLADFKERVKAYESAYVPLGDYEEDHEMQYIKMTDVGKKLTHFGLGGFLSSGISHYLSSFNLSPRQIWITRHGQSVDNQLGKIGGNSELTDRGHFYSLALYKFVTQKRKEWLVEQKDKIAQSSFPPLPGDQSPPYPDLNRELDEKNFCVWTSMLMRSIQTAQHFEADEDYDVKNWEMLNELNAGKFEGHTYDEIAHKHKDEYTRRQMDKLHYVYPGVGGEGYLQVISRLRDMVREIERIKDHVMIIGHRSVCRVLMAYFMDLTRDDIADLDMPLGMLYAIEPKPYGIEFHAYKYNEEKGSFDEMPNYRPTTTVDRSA